MTEHLLKTWPAEFAAVMRGDKLFEFRKDDRGFAVGDVLVLREWDPVAGDYVQDIGEGVVNVVCAVVTYLVRGPAFGIPEGFCIMSIHTMNRAAAGHDDMGKTILGSAVGRAISSEREKASTP